MKSVTVGELEGKPTTFKTLGVEKRNITDNNGPTNQTITML